MKKKEGQVTLRDIARALDLSINTISCALKNTNNISPETIKRVKEKANELGYIPDSIARSIRTGYTKTIAIILGDITNAYFSIMLKEIERLISDEGYVAIILATDENPFYENNAIQVALSKKVDGIILFPTCRSQDGINLMRKVGIPFILIGRHLQDTKMNYIISDDISGGYLATKHLIDKGYKIILHFAGPDYISSAFERKQGYCKAMEENGLEYKNFIVPCGITIDDEMDNLIVKILKQHKVIDAIFTYNDIIAFRLLRFARIMNVKIKEVVGYDNVQSKIDFGFDITSVNINKTLMAKKAVTWLLSLINRGIENEEFLNEIVPVDLYIKKNINTFAFSERPAY